MDKYKRFFDEFQSFKTNQDKQKQRGFNNYNILTSVLKKSDEVRLHSRMLYSLLNPQGEHYQETLFLDMFLNILDIDGFNIQSKDCKVYKEYRNIDLYITDGSKHIILENKIHASDQDKQIERYVNTILKENEGLCYDDVLVIYLSLDRQVPEQYSMGAYELSGNFITNDNEKLTLFKSIHYKNEILSWLEKCQYEIQNIMNLNEVFIQYIDVVKMINGLYKDKIMTLEDYIINDKDFFEVALEIEKTFPSVRKKLMDKFFGEVKTELEKQLEKDWTIEIVGDLSTRYSFPLRIYKKTWINDDRKSLIIGFEFGQNDFKNGYIGIVRLNNKTNIQKDVVNNFGNELIELDYPLKTTQWWLHYEYINRKEQNLFKNAYNNDTASSEFTSSIMNIVNKFELETNLLTKVNSHLGGKL